MVKKYFLFYYLLLIINVASAQSSEKFYFDVSGNKSSQEGAYYYRILEKYPDFYKSFYTSSSKVYFEGRITQPDNSNEANNKYTGKCIWYYKNEKKKTERNFNDNNIETGLTTWYYESGKIWKEQIYNNGTLTDGRYKEYSEDGDVTLIWEENFDNNITDWDLYKSNSSSSEIVKGSLVLKSFTDEGTSRYVNLPIKAGNYIIETTVNLSESKGRRESLIWGFKDWNNYNYISISTNYVYVGSIYEGVNMSKVDGLYANEINKNGINTIKLFAEDGKLIITINGVLLTRTSNLKLHGSQLGFIVSGKSGMSIDQLIVKEFTGENSNIIASSELDVKSSGTGFLISTSGYIATNYHVIENNDKIIVDLSLNDETRSFEASVVQKDEQNDLVILKLNNFENVIPEIEYSFSESSTISVGNSVFTIGYPYALNGMGKEAKFADGKISAKTGFNNAINSFQTTIPVQPGNSGSPVFSESGQLIGIMNAKFQTADNVSYAIKLNYLKNIFELLTDNPMPDNPKISSLPLEEKIKILTKYIVLIKIK